MELPTVLLLLLLLLFEIESDASIRSAIRFANYSANPVGSIELMVKKPGTFENIMRIDPVIFLTKVVSVMIPDMKLPRGYIIRDDYQLTGMVQRMRECQIDAVDRCIRWWLGFRSVSFQLLALYFDQDPSTVYRDWHHLSILCVEKLGPVYLQPIIPYSEEYYSKIGQRAFRHFPNALYALDVVKVMYSFIYIFCCFVCCVHCI